MKTKQELLADLDLLKGSLVEANHPEVQEELGKVLPRCRERVAAVVVIGSPRLALAVALLEEARALVEGMVLES